MSRDWARVLLHSDLATNLAWVAALLIISTSDMVSGNSPLAVGVSNDPTVAGGVSNDPPVVGGVSDDPLVAGGMSDDPPVAGGVSDDPPVVGGVSDDPPASGGNGNDPPADGGDGNDPPSDGGHVEIGWHDDPVAMGDTAGTETSTTASLAAILLPATASTSRLL